MHRAVVLLIALSACGRIGFAPNSEDARGDAAVTPRSLELPAGGQMQQTTVSSDGAWYAMTGSGAAFRSLDQGGSWARCGDQVGTALSVTSDGVVWMSGDDVLRSTDQCATWQPTSNPRHTDYVFAEGMNVWSCTDQGLARWNGSTWTVVSTPVGATPFVWMSRGGSRYFIGTFSQGLLTSTDAVTWTHPATTAFQSLTVEQVAGGATHSYAITAGGTHNTVCSDQTGVTWSSCYNIGGLTLTVDPADDQHVIAGIYDDLIETRNAFTSVTRGLREMSMDSAIIYDVRFHANGELVAATARGVFVAPPGTLAFSPRNTGLDAWDVDAIFVDGEDIWLGTRGGPLHSARGEPFTWSTAGIVANTAIRGFGKLPDGRILAGGRGLEATSDGGASWTTIYDAQGIDGYYTSAIAMVGTRLVFGTGTRVVSSDPPYATFTPHALNGGNRPVIAMHVQGSKLWIATTDGLLLSLDGGATTVDAGLATLRINALSELADGTLLAATSNGVWISDASGTTWQRAGLMGVFVYGIGLAPDGTWIASTARNVQFTRDGGATWSLLPGAEKLAASAAIFDDTTGQLLIGSDTRGLVRVPLP